MHNLITSEDTDEPFLVRTHGLVDRVRLHSTPGTKDGDIMLTAFLCGRGQYRNSEGTIAVGADMIGIVPPDDPGILLADRDDPYRHYYCRFRGTYATHRARQIIARTGCRFFASPHAQAVADCIRRMGTAHTGTLSLCMGTREVALAEALVLLGPSNPAQSNSLSASSLASYLHELVSDPTDLGLIAEHFSVSVPTLCRNARPLLGTTIQRYHERVRIEWAKRLLRETSLRIGEVAARVGYSDPLYFSRVFRQAAGVSPRAWRKAESVRHSAVS